MSGFTFEKHADHFLLRFRPEIAEIPWPELEAETNSVIKLIHDAAVPSVIVDLVELQQIPSGLVAALVRAWKGMDEQCRKFVVVSPHAGVREELQQTGLTSLWQLTDSLEAGYSALDVSDAVVRDSNPVSDTAAAAETAASETSAAAPVTKVTSDPAAQPFIFEEQRGYCSVRFNPVLMSMNWSDVETGTTQMVEKLQQTKINSVMVDLGAMDMINSGLIASLVRIWKTMQQKNGQFSLVCPNQMIVDVLKAAGLWKLWSVVDEREEAIYQLGASKVALVERRERRLLMLVAVFCALFSALALIPMFLKRTDVLGVNAQLTALLLAAAALATGLISILKDKGGHRLLSLLAVLTSIAVLSTLWFRGNPIAFGQLLPEQTQKSDGPVDSPDVNSD